MSAKLSSTKHSHPRRLLAMGVATALLAPLISSAEPESNKEEKEAMKGTFPTLDILPEGSILRRVRLPRYNKDFVPITLLTAETLTVLDKHRIDGTDITIELYDENGNLDARTKMRHAIYNQKLSTLNAHEAIFIEGQSYVANGTGLVFDWNSSQGFLIGPVNTRFHKSLTDKSTTMFPRHKQAPRVMANSLMVLTSLTTSAIAEPPARLTPKQHEELNRLTQPTKPTKLTAAQHEELDQLIQPISPQMAIEQRQTLKSLAEDDRMNHMANNHMAPFLNKIDQGALLVSTTDSKPDEKPKVSKKNPEQAEKKAADADPKKPVPTLKVTCDGGLYFDSETGILAYLKNIRLVEPRFNLTCTNELKIILEKKEPKKTKPEKDKKQKTATTSEKDKSSIPKEKSKDKDEDNLADTMASFGDIRRIIATGRVKLTRLDEKGNRLTATAETASYDAKTGEMILRGGLPRIQTGPNQYIQARAKGQYIRILRSGKFIAEGQWDTVTPTEIEKP